MGILYFSMKNPAGAALDASTHLFSYIEEDENDSMALYCQGVNYLLVAYAIHKIIGDAEMYIMYSRSLPVRAP